MWAKFFKRAADQPSVQAGSIYHRVRKDNTVETAKVLAVRDDSFGIPHVQYQLCIGRRDNDHILVEGQRILSLSCFAAHYGEYRAS